MSLKTELKAMFDELLQLEDGYSESVRHSEMLSNILAKFFPIKVIRAVCVDGVNGDDDNSGEGWLEALKTVQAAIDVASNGEIIAIAPGSLRSKELYYSGRYDEAVSIPGTKRDLTLVGVGPRGSVGIRATGSSDVALTVLGDDITLINLGTQSKGSAVQGLLVRGERFRAFECKFEMVDNLGIAVKLKPGQVTDQVAGTIGSASDCLFEDCEFSWAEKGLVFENLLGTNGDDNLCCTQNKVKNCNFHNVSVVEIGAIDNLSGGPSVKNLQIKGCTFDRMEDGSAPTDFIVINNAEDTGIIEDCSFAYATNEADVITIGAKILYVANKTEAGVSSARPA